MRALMNLFGAPKRKTKAKRRVAKPKAKRKTTAKRTYQRRKTQRSARKGPLANWWAGQLRRLRYLRQGLAPYALSLCFSLTLLMVAALWASGIFGQLRDELSRISERLLSAQGFAIEQVTIEGREHTDKDDLNLAFRAMRGQSLLHFDLARAKARIEILDWVDEASVIRLWPKTLHIVVTEKRPAAIWQQKGQLTLIDRAGGVISSDHLQDFGNLPQVVGAGAAVKAAELHELLRQFPLVQSRVRASIRVARRRWNLRLDSGVDVLLPDQNEERALRQLIELEERHRLLARDITVIDLRNPDRLFVRLSSDQILQFNTPGLET